MNAITDDKINNGLKNAVTQILNILPENTAQKSRKNILS